MKKLPEYTSDDNMFFYMNALVDLVNSQQEAIEKLERVITRETVRIATDDIIDALSGSEEPIEMVSKARYAEKLGIHDTHRTDKVDPRDMASRNPSPEAKKALEAAVQQSQEDMNKMSTHRTVTLRIPRGLTLVEALFYADLSLNMSDNQAKKALDKLKGESNE